MSEAENESTIIVPDDSGVSAVPVVKTSQIVWGVFWGMWLFAITASIVWGIGLYMRAHNVI